MTKRDEIIDLVQTVLRKLGVEGTVTAQEREGGYYISVETPDSALLIGRYGETLEALQFIVRILAQKLLLAGERLTLDVNAYRRQREEELLTFVTEVAERVKSTGMSETLRPMSSYERRLVHQVVDGMGGLTSGSTGEGPDRRITIQIKN